VLLAHVGREIAAARLQAFTRIPPGIAVFIDGDPSADILYRTLSTTQLRAEHATGRTLSYEDALAYAIAELEPFLVVDDRSFV